MPVLRKKNQPKDRFVQNGLYVHSSPPRVLSLSSAHIRQLVRSGDIDRLENVVLEGQGKKLLGEYSSNFRTRIFLKSIPQLMLKISLVHDAVNSGRLEELQSLLDEEDEKTRKKVVGAKDEAGVGLLHKAIYYDLKEIAKWLVDKHAHIVNVKDADGRTAYHYTSTCKDAQGIQRMLTRAGADPHAVDNLQHTAKYYGDHNGDLELPSAHKSMSGNRNVNRGDLSGSAIKKSNIRIWIHQRDLQGLQRVIWEGQGQRLLVEHSNNQRVRRFLEAVPYVMGVVKEVHADVVKDDLAALRARMEPPVSSAVLMGKDGNGLSALHKAVGLGRKEIAEYIITTCPQTINLTDNEGRTALHYAPLAKDNGLLFNQLIDAGADESHLDHKRKTAAFYKSRTNELDAKHLTVIPDCPRLAKESHMTTYDWNLMGSHVNSAITPTDTEHKDIINNNTEDNETTSDKDTTDVEEVNGHNNGDLTEDVIIDSSSSNAIEQQQDELEINTTTDDLQEVEHEEIAAIDGEIAADEPSEDLMIKSNQNEEEQLKTDENLPDDDTTAEESEPVEDADVTAEDNLPTEEAEEVIVVPEEVIVVPEEVVVDQQDEVKVVENDVDSVEGVIEGVVNGENEIESVNEEGQGSSGAEDDPDVQKLIDSGNMEQLAGMVLNGDGDKLLGQHSGVAELQSFLENVPTYMMKIKKIHTAARAGGLKELQAALDRRKFAIARDKMSPNGATPLHVACVFGNTSIVRYLAGRFPETIGAVDADGRAPLHYAAVVTDNGHYYNLLVHLGANTRAEDKYGHTPEFYKSNQGALSHRSLLRDFGAEELLADEMLQDKVPFGPDLHSARKNLDDEDMSAVLERCYSVLHGRRRSSTGSATSAQTTASRGDRTPQLMLSRHTRRSLFDAVKLRITKLDHSLYDVIWPSVKKLPTDVAFKTALERDFPMGIVAPDYYAYKVFGEYLMPIIKDANNIDSHLELGAHPKSKFVNISSSENADEETIRIVEVDLDLDPSVKYIINGTLECTRNLSKYNLPKYLNITQLELVERALTSCLLSRSIADLLYPNATEQDIEDKGSGTYYTINEVLEDPSEIRLTLASNGLMIPLWDIPDSDRLHGKHYPYGRGVFVSNSANLAVWINVLDHLRIITCTSQTKPGNIGQIYSRVYRLIGGLSERLQFEWDEKLGWLSARPTALGNTLQFNLNVKFPQLSKEPDNLRHLCFVRGLNLKRSAVYSDIVSVGNQQCMGVAELQTFEDFSAAVSNIMQLEKDLAMTNSMHIAAMFVNMFRRKKGAE